MPQRTVVIDDQNTLFRAFGRGHPQHPTLSLSRGQPGRIVREMPATKSEPAEQPFLGTQEELRRLFMLSLDLLCIVDFDGYFKLLNPAWEKLLDYTTEEMLAKPWVEFLHPDDRDSSLHEAAKLYEGVRVILFRNRFRARDGSYRWISWMASPDMERQLGYCIGRDVTDFKRSEEELQA